MRYLHSNNPSAYSIILSILTIGFLLVLTTSTLNLVLQEMQDGRGKQNYMKSYAAAEAGMELALLEIKAKGYGYATSLIDSNILGNENKDPFVSYQYDSKVSSHSGALNSYQTEIIPLFWIDEFGVTHSVEKISLGGSSEIVWNLVGKKSGVSGKGPFLSSDPIGEKKISTVSGNNDFVFDDTRSVLEFLFTNTGSYLTVYNPTINLISYTIESGDENIYFSKPATTILSQAKVGKYTQNLETYVDNTEFLGILKYSIYSGD